MVEESKEVIVKSNEGDKGRDSQGEKRQVATSQR